MSLTMAFVKSDSGADRASEAGLVVAAAAAVVVVANLVANVSVQAEAEARERHWQSEVQGLQSKVEKLEGLLQREMGHHQLNSPTPRLVHDVSPAGVAQADNSCRKLDSLFVDVMVLGTPAGSPPWQVLAN